MRSVNTWKKYKSNRCTSMKKNLIVQYATHIELVLSESLVVVPGVLVLVAEQLDLERLHAQQGTVGALEQK